MAADPRPAKRIVNPAACRAKVLLEACCRICGQTRDLQAHHILARSQGGDDVADNTMPLCLLCHEAVEHHRAGWRVRLRRELEPAEVAYLTAKRSVAWLDTQYPEAA